MDERAVGTNVPSSSGTNPAARVRVPAVIGPVVGKTEAASGAPRADTLGVVRLLTELDLEPLLVTRVGEDPAGQTVLEALARLGLSRSGVQVDPELSTTPAASPRSASEEAVFAYQALDANQSSKALRDASPELVFQCFDAVPTEGLLDTINRIREDSGLPFFVDFDLVSPWMTKEHARRILLGARWLRIDRGNMPLLTRRELGPAFDRISAAALEIRRSFALDAVVVTHQGRPMLIAELGSISRLTHGDAPPPGAPERMRAAVTASLVVAALHHQPFPEFLGRTTSLSFARTDPQASQPGGSDEHDWSRAAASQSSGEGTRK